MTENEIANLKQSEHSWKINYRATMDVNAQLRVENAELRGAAKRLRMIYDVLHDIHDRCDDEGDRIYLGSTEDRHTLKRQLRYLEKAIPSELLYPAFEVTP